MQANRTPWSSAVRVTWLESLEELVNLAGIESELSTLVGEAELLLEPIARELVVVRPVGFEPLRWVRALAAGEPVPAQNQLTAVAISAPGILLTQMAAIRALTRQGLDLTEPRRWRWPDTRRASSGRILKAGGALTPNCWRCCNSRAPPARWSRGGAAWSDGATSRRCCR